ncbi:MAG: DUF4268 domain-containing protein [Acidobacteria bacterium]|nr:DUF4268 domain-containing protein [Acidobacteriota bacterium]
MKPDRFGRLERVDLREGWRSEASDFTPWLAQEENLKLLGDSIGIDLECEAQEKSVGPFRADILCKDTATDNWVLIENQLDRTDHTHLGQLLTYAAGLNAVTIVWVAERFTDEHRAALDWLNERTDDNINLFGLEIELWRIGDSPIAPKFNIISQPNDWSRTVREAAGAVADISQSKQAQLAFSTGFKRYMESKGSFVRCQKPLPQHWTNHAIGRSGIHLSSVVSGRNSETGVKAPEIRAELYLDADDAKREFSILEKQRANIESALAFPLTWHNPEDKALCRIYTRLDADYRDQAQWPQQFEWLRQRLEKLHGVFAPLVRNLRADPGNGEP